MTIFPCTLPSLHSYFFLDLFPSEFELAVCADQCVLTLLSPTESLLDVDSRWCTLFPLSMSATYLASFAVDGDDEQCSLDVEQISGDFLGFNLRVKLAWGRQLGLMGVWSVQVC